jgi:hypothetical protein
MLNGMSSNNTAVLCIAHNGSTNPRGEPYDLPFIAYRSLYNLSPIKKNYRDTYSATDGINWCGFNEFPRLFFLDTIRMVGQNLQLAKKKIASLGLDAIAKEFKVGEVKKGDMTYTELARLSTTYGSDMSLCIEYCLQDCAVTKAIDEHLDLSNLKVALVEKCNVPLSQALHCTMA